jgi:hypothetical protein
MHGVMEAEGLSRIFETPDNPENLLLFGGEVAGRIKFIPTVKELIETIVNEAERIIRKMPGFLSTHAGM